MSNCDFGCDKDGIFYFKSSGKWCCETSPNKCYGKRKKDSDSKKGINPFEGKEHPRGYKGKISWMKDKTYEELYGFDKSYEIKKKLSLSQMGHVASDESKKKMSEKATINIKIRYDNGWQPKAGRCKKLSYESPIAGPVLVDGYWEYTFCNYLDLIGVVWKRNKQRFIYTNLQGKESHYTPDFYINDCDCFVEIKGYETDLDRCKCIQFSNKLLVIKKDLYSQIIDFVRKR